MWNATCYSKACEIKRTAVLQVSEWVKDLALTIIHIPAAEVQQQWKAMCDKAGWILKVVSGKFSCAAFWKYRCVACFDNLRCSYRLLCIIHVSDSAILWLKKLGIPLDILKIGHTNLWNIFSYGLLVCMVF